MIQQEPHDRPVLLYFYSVYQKQYFSLTFNFESLNYKRFLPSSDLRLDLSLEEEISEIYLIKKHFHNMKPLQVTENLTTRPLT